MINISELNPDIALCSLLDGRVSVQTSATDSRTIKCYPDGKMPNKGLEDEFISVLWNGAAKSRTRPIGCFQGNLALTIFCKLQADNTVKTNRVRQVLGQCQKLADGKLSDGFVFTIDPSSVITPTYADTSIGYSKTTVNVEWRTTI